MAVQAIMTRAHELAAAMEGDYTARLSMALRQAWAEVRNEGKTIEARFAEIGGNLWERHGHRRIYFNNLTELYGLDLDYYNTGNISSATLDGEGISNNSARIIASDLKFGKLWFDLNTGSFASRDLPSRMADKLVERIKEAA